MKISSCQSDEHIRQSEATVTQEETDAAKLFAFWFIMMISELLDVQRLLVTQLEDARLSLARRQERELVEERMIQVFEARLSG